MIDKTTVIVSTVCIWLLCATLSAHAGGTSDDVDTIETALLLGAASLDILFDRLAAQSDNNGNTIPRTEAPLRIEIDTYIRVLGLSDVRYPKDPVSSPDNVAPLANYGQSIVDQLDEVHRAAFLVGWYGRILLRNTGGTDSSKVICDFAEEAGYEVNQCLQNTTTYFSKLLNTARGG